MILRDLTISFVVACFSFGTLFASKAHAIDASISGLLKIRDERELEDSILKALSYPLERSLPLEAQNPFKIAELGEKYRKQIGRAHV